MSGLLVADVVDGRGIGPPVGHRLRQGGQLAHVLLPLGPKLREESDTAK